MSSFEIRLPVQRADRNSGEVEEELQELWFYGISGRRRILEQMQEDKAGGQAATTPAAVPGWLQLDLPVHVQVAFFDLGVNRCPTLGPVSPWLFITEGGWIEGARGQLHGCTISTDMDDWAIASQQPYSFMH